MRVLDFCVIVAVAGAPWIVGIAYYWRRRPKGDELTQSWGEYLRRRMTVR